MEKEDWEMVARFKQYVAHHNHTHIVYFAQTDDKDEQELSKWTHEVRGGRRIVSDDIEKKLLENSFDFRKPYLGYSVRRIETTAMRKISEQLTVLLQECDYLKDGVAFKWKNMDVPFDDNMPFEKKPDGMHWAELDNEIYFLKYEGEEHRHHDRTVEQEQAKNSYCYVAAIKLCDTLGKRLGGFHFVHDNYAEVRDYAEGKLNTVCEVLKDSIVNPSKTVKITFVDFPTRPLFPTHKHVLGAYDLLVSSHPFFAKCPAEYDECPWGGTWPLYDVVELKSSPEFWPGGRQLSRADHFMDDNDLQYSRGWQPGGQDWAKEEEGESEDEDEGSNE